MSDLKKLLDEGDDFERSLLGAAIDQDEDRKREARTLAALGLGPVGPAPVPDGGGGAAAGGGAALGKWLAVAAVGGAAIAGAIVLWPDPTGAPEPRSVVSPVPEASVPKSTIEPLPPVQAVPEPAVTPKSSGVRVRPPPSAPSPPKSDASSLTREIAALDRVRAALKAGDSARAKAELDRYDRDFPFGSLGPEARALRARLNKKDGSEKKP